MKEAITVKCPACSHEFPLSEAVMGSVREDISKELQADLQRRESQLSERSKALLNEQEALKKQAEGIHDQVDQLAKKRVTEQLAEVRKRAEQQAMEAQESILKQLREELNSKSLALKAAREQELALLKQKRELEEAKENLQLEVQRKLDEERAKLKEQLQSKIDEENRLKFAERDKIIADLKENLKDAQRKAEQGSQQAQGEILELDFLAQLIATFPVDRIAEIAKGVRGGDVLHEVVSHTGRSCGFVLYENKRTKNWSDAWITKLKGDMIGAKAELGVIVSEVLPPGVKSFGLVDGVWVTDLASALALAGSLRWAIQQLAIAKLSQEGASEKMAVLYRYLTGSEFRQRVEAVINAFSTMKEDLEAEKRALTKYWARREKQLTLVVENMASMVGDIEGISGHALPAIPSLELPE